MKESNRLHRVEILDNDTNPVSVEIERERRLAIFDLLEGNSFALEQRGESTPPPGPYVLTLSIEGRMLVFDVSTEDGPVVRLLLSLTPFIQTVSDYLNICQAYYDAIKHMPLDRIEAIDMGRRGIHDEGGRLIQKRLEGKVVVDLATARRLFTLLCALLQNH